MEILTAASILCHATGFAAERGWVIENEDNDHYFYGKDVPDCHTKHGLEAYVDRLLAGGGVTHIFWCVNGQRPNYDSKAWEPIWKALDDPLLKHGHSSDAWPKNAKAMFDAGIDPYRIWISRTKEKGASAWVSMRMNDTHDIWVPHAARVCRFSQEHPEYWVIPNYKGGQWWPYALDFSHKEVRDWTFSLAKEIIERYDADGIELDFLRSESYFHPDVARDRAPLMTEFISRIREVANAAGEKRGRPYQVAVRFGATIEDARSRGFAVEEILKRGLVDVVIACNQSNANWDIPVSEWKELIADKSPNVRFVAGTTAWSHTPASLRGWAHAMRACNAENFYIFNLHWAAQDRQDAVRKEDAFGERGCNAFPREYAVDHCIPGNGIFGEPMTKPHAFKRSIPKGAVSGVKSVEVAIRLASSGGEPSAVALNGSRELSRATCRFEGDRLLTCVFPLASVVEGDNTIAVETALEGAKTVITGVSLILK